MTCEHSSLQSQDTIRDRALVDLVFSVYVDYTALFTWAKSQEKEVQKDMLNVLLDSNTNSTAMRLVKTLIININTSI